MVSERVKIVNTLGMHARPAAQFVKITTKYECAVFVEKDGMRVNAKSIMGVMMLAAEQDSEILIECEGSGEENCLSELTELVNIGFNEE